MTTPWSSEAVRSSERTEAWEAALAEHFCAWDLDRAVAPDFRADIRHRDLGGLRLVDTHCDPCAGHRPQRLVSQDPDVYFGIQLAKEGRKVLEIDGVSLEINRGDMLMWTSDQPVAFKVEERMHKVSLVLPWSEIRERLPERRHFKSAVIKGQRGIGAVLYSHIDSLTAQLDSLEPDDLGAARRATIELLVAVLSHRMDAPPKALAQRYLERLQAYVVENLQDAELSPASIAEANRMSVRYVHLLFAQTGLSVSSWIRAQRLERCREELESFSRRQDGVSEIAYRWGFRDPMHFSRLFKKHYGLNPTQYRMGQTG